MPRASVSLPLGIRPTSATPGVLVSGHPLRVAIAGAIAAARSQVAGHEGDGHTSLQSGMCPALLLVAATGPRSGRRVAARAIAHRTPRTRVVNNDARIPAQEGTVNVPRKATEAVEMFELLMDTRKEMTDAATIPAEALTRYADMEERVYQLLMHLDESIGLAVTMLRRGPDSPSIQRRMCQPGHLRLVHSRHDTPPSAA